MLLNIFFKGGVGHKYPMQYLIGLRFRGQRFDPYPGFKKLTIITNKLTTSIPVTLGGGENSVLAPISYIELETHHFREIFGTNSSRGY